MKQILQNLSSGLTQVLEVPIPAPRPGTALVQTAASLVSAGTERILVEFAEKSLVGKARSRPDLVRQMIDKARREGVLTTLEAAFNRLDQPMPLGYSAAGILVEKGTGLQGFQVGQRVACAGGNYAVHAEYEVVPQNLLTHLPDSVDFESAAFTTLGAIAMHGFRLAKPQIGESIAIIGLGLLGLLCVELASAAGCQVFGTDLDPRRVALAQQLGAQACLREHASEAALTFTRGRGCDAVLICADSASSDPVELAGDLARDRARIVAIGAVGLQLPRRIYYEKELSFVNSRSYGPGRYDPDYEEAGQDYPIGYVRWTEGRNLEAFVDLLATRRVDVHPLITHRFPIEEAPQAYDLITGKTGEPFLGVILTYPPHESADLSGQILLRKVATTNKDHLPAEFVPPETTSRVSLGVLGAGNFATAVMLPILKKITNIEPIGVASASGVNAQHAAQRYGFKYATSDENQVIADPAINTIAILTRHHLHARQVLAALDAGKHVFCEKPLVLTWTELQEIQEFLLREQLPVAPNQTTPPSNHFPLVTVGFNRRFAPLAQKLFTFFNDRKEPLLAHYRVNAGYIPLSHWLHDPLQGGGRILGEGCHFIDFLTCLVGVPPVEVSGRGLPDAGRYLEDNVTLTFTFPDGSIGTLTYLANGDKAFSKERVEVFTGGRVAVLDDYRSLELVSNGRIQRHRTRLHQDKGHHAEWDAFVAAILERKGPPIPYEHLIGVAGASLAALEALRNGRTVRIPQTLRGETPPSEEIPGSQKSD